MYQVKELCYLCIVILVPLVMTLKEVACQETTTEKITTTILITNSPVFISEEYRAPPNKTVLLMAPDQISDIDFVTMVTVLRKAKIDLFIVGEHEKLKYIVSESKMIYLTQMRMTEAIKWAPFDAVVVPGGKGYISIANLDLREKIQGNLAFKKKHEGIYSRKKTVLENEEIYTGFTEGLKMKQFNFIITGLHLTDLKMGFCFQDKLYVKTLKKHFKKKKYVVLMSTAPRILAINRLEFGRQVTCHESMIKYMRNDYQIMNLKGVVMDGNLITTAGPAHAIDCALLLVERLVGKKEAVEMSQRLIYTH